MLLQNGMEIEERDFFKDPFRQEEIEVLALHEGLGNLFARRSPSLKKLGLDGQNLPDSQIMGLMLQEPRLIRRPLVLIGGRLIVGAGMKTIETALHG